MKKLIAVLVVLVPVLAGCPSKQQTPKGGFTSHPMTRTLLAPPPALMAPAPVAAR